MEMGKTVRLMAGAAGMVPALGLAMAAPAAPAAAAVHASGKKVSLQAGQAPGATACTGTHSKIATASTTHLAISVAYEGSCVLSATGVLRRFNESPGSLSGDQMRTQVRYHGSKVFSNRAMIVDSSGFVHASQKVDVIGHTVCMAAFSRVHPSEKIAGPVCVKI
jgi:hypothetical protein